MEHYKEIGSIVYLKASYETIQNRIHDPKKRGVVLKDSQTLKELYEERAMLFEHYADYVVCADGLNIQDTIEKVLELFEK